MNNIPLSRFAKALSNPDVNLTRNTRYRYRNGAVPRRFIQLLVDNPQIAQALFDDIKAAQENRANPAQKPLDTTY